MKTIIVKAICHGCSKVDNECKRPLSSQVGDWRRAINIQQFNGCRDYKPEGTCHDCYNRVHFGVANFKDQCVVYPEITHAVTPGSCSSYIARELAPLDQWLRKGYADTGKYASDSQEQYRVECRPVPGKKSCFLTTACVGYYGLDDDCDLLRSMRALRDEYVANMDLGNDLIANYYEVSPVVVERINALPDDERGNIYSFIMDALLASSAHVCSGKLQDAYEGYARLYRSLCDRLDLAHD